MLTGIAHVNLTVPAGTLDQAAEFYANTLGMTRVEVPVLQRDTLAWYHLSPPPISIARPSSYLRLVIMLDARPYHSIHHPLAQPLPE